MSKWAYAVAGFAALFGAAGVMEAAAAAHAISSPLLRTSADVLIVNAAAVIAISALAMGSARGQCWLLIAAATLLIGSVLFCGELSAHVFLAGKLLPLAAPIGGGLMILGWLIAAVTAFVCLARYEQNR